MPLVRIKKRFQITLPKSVRDPRLKVGDYLEISAKNGGYILSPKRIIDLDEAEKKNEQD